MQYESVHLREETQYEVLKHFRLEETNDLLSFKVISISSTFRWFYVFSS